MVDVTPEEFEELVADANPISSARFGRFADLNV